MFGRLMNNYYYGKSGKGDYRKEDLPKNRWQLFWEMLRVRLSGLFRINLMTCVVWLPMIIVVVMMVNSFATASSLTTVQDEESGSSYVALVYDPVTDDEGNVTSEGSTIAAQSLIQMFFIMLIPCILITGPVQTGLAYVTRNWARDEHAFPWADFKDAVKDNWKQGLGISAITAVVPYIAYTCYYFYGQMSKTNTLFIVPQMLTLVLVFVWFLGLVFMYPLIVCYKLTFRQLLKNGVLLAVARLPMTVGIRLATMLPTIIGVAVVLLTGQWVYTLLILCAYYLLLGNAMTRFVYASFTNGVFDKYINSKIEGVEVNRGLAKDEDEEEAEEEEEEDTTQNLNLPQ